MKGTLLLALLVIGELGFQTTEACAPFIGAYLAVLSGNALTLNTYISKFQATAAERVAFEKIQDCFSVEPLTTKIWDPQIMLYMLFSQKCKKYYANDSLKKMEDLFNQRNIH